MVLLFREGGGVFVFWFVESDRIHVMCILCICIADVRLKP